MENRRKILGVCAENKHKKTIEKPRQGYKISYKKEKQDMNKYLYVRVSTKEQNTDRQLADVERLGIPTENVFIDKQSGKDFNREEYQKLINKLQEGDIVYFHSIDRMGRSYEDIIHHWNHITKEIKADIIILDMPLLDTTAKNEDLTGRFIADLVLQILSYVAEKERENTRQRQAEGIAIAKENGVYKKKDIDMDLFIEYKNKVDSGKMSVSAASRFLSISRVTWYRLCESIYGEK